MTSEEIPLPLSRTRFVAKLLLGGLFNTGFFAAHLLGPAGLVSGGTWRWTRALVFLAAYWVIFKAGMIVLAIAAPASLESNPW